MTSFFVLFDEWDGAASAAAGASARLCRQLDAWCAGTGPAPPAREIAQTKWLMAQANLRLAALRALLDEQREQVAVI